MVVVLSCIVGFFVVSLAELVKHFAGSCVLHDVSVMSREDRERV